MRRTLVCILLLSTHVALAKSDGTDCDAALESPFPEIEYVPVLRVGTPGSGAQPLRDAMVAMKSPRITDIPSDVLADAVAKQDEAHAFPEWAMFHLHGLKELSFPIIRSNGMSWVSPFAKGEVDGLFTDAESHIRGMALTLSMPSAAALGYDSYRGLLKKRLFRLRQAGKKRPS